MPRRVTPPGDPDRDQSVHGRGTVPAARDRSPVERPRPRTATGEASASDAHWQFRNCRGGIIASATTAMASADDTSSRCRNADVSSAPSSSAAPPADRRGGEGRTAV